MANNFYNVNIHKFNPAQLHVAPGTPVPDENVQDSSQPTETPQNQILPPQNQEQEQGGHRNTGHARLNALDSTILENEAYQNIDDEVLKTEYKINRLEGAIKNINEEIQDAKDINDFQRADDLIMQRRNLEARLQALNKNYEKGGMPTRLSGELASIIEKPKVISKAFQNCVNFMSNKILPKISKTFKSGKSIKSALDRLETINKNVDEIVTTQTPYGEADERYEKLSDYLNSANVIHYQISKKIDTPTFFDTISSIDKQKLSADMKKNHSNFGKMTGSNRQKMV